MYSRYLSNWTSVQLYTWFCETVILLLPFHTWSNICTCLRQNKWWQLTHITMVKEMVKGRGRRSFGTCAWTTWGWVHKVSQYHMPKKAESKVLFTCLHLLKGENLHFNGYGKEAIWEQSWATTKLMVFFKWSEQYLLRSLEITAERFYDLLTG